MLMPELLRELPVVADDIRLAEVRAARGEGHRDQALVVGLKYCGARRRASSPSMRSVLPA